MGLDLARPLSPEGQVLYESGARPSLATSSISSKDGSPSGSASGSEEEPSSLYVLVSLSFAVGPELMDSSIQDLIYRSFSHGQAPLLSPLLI